MVVQEKHFNPYFLLKNDIRFNLQKNNNQNPFVFASP